MDHKFYDKRQHFIGLYNLEYTKLIYVYQTRRVLVLNKNRKCTYYLPTEGGSIAQERRKWKPLPG